MEKGIVIGLSCGAGGVVLLILILTFVRYKFKYKSKDTVTSRKLSNTVTSDIDGYTQSLQLDVEIGSTEVVTPNSKPLSEQERLDFNRSRRSSLSQNQVSNAASHYDYPSSTQKSILTPVNHTILNCLDSEFEDQENIYENVEPRRNSRQIQPSKNPTSTITHPTPTTSYSSVLFSIQNQSIPQTNPQNLALSFKTLSINRRLSPPIRRNTVKTRRHKPTPRFQFPHKTLVIAVDATPRHLGGYMTNPFSNRVEFYSVPSSRLPWILRNRTRSGNPTEFEMKNLLIALLLWEDHIVRHRRVAIFTDNSAFVGRSMYSARVRSYIRHLEDCRQVLHVNPDWTFVNSKENSDLFQQFIVPADQLSRLNEAGFRDSMRANHYEIHEGEISHVKFNTIRQKMLYWTRNKCGSCGFHIPKSGSLKRWLH